ncbi:MAG: putative toxin-antitoxin system toxin component, PIN family [Solirubrobacteraceae bacterium]
MPVAAVRSEISLILARPRLRKYFQADEPRRFLGDLAAQTILLPDPAQPYRRVCRDPNDDYLVALAIKARAMAIVTGDRDLLAIDRPHADLGILRPREFIERLT